MTAIRLSRSGLNVAGAVRARGEVVDVEADVADYLCSSGQAVRVGSADPDEAMVTGAPETTARRTTARPGKPSRRRR